MPNFQDLIKNDLARGIALGVGAALVAAAAIPVIVTATRPLARVALKSGILLLEKGREVMAEAGENFEDLVAEVKAEMAEQRGGFAPDSAGQAVRENAKAEG
ncbi:MAG: DUF5132 domain-containing protein [Methylococcaceae bacterium]|nr:DUF5132 domain-containing protein [Methylococcaceae bacterium]